MRYAYKNIHNLRDNSVILHFGELQTFYLHNFPESLIIHLAGWGKEDRIKITKEFRKLYIS